MTTEEIIALCDGGVVPYTQWSDRDTPSAQSQLATARSHLLSGCKWRISIDKILVGEDTLWIEILHYYFEGKETWHLYYIPKQNRLDENKGRDWY